MLPFRHLRTASALLATALLHGCGDHPALQDPEGRFVVGAIVDIDTGGGDDLRGAMARHRCDLLVAPDARLATIATANAAPTSIVAITDRTDPGFAATVVPADLADAALDLARLSTSDELAPQHLALGARWSTAANAAAGGAPVPAPGDFALRILCMQHQQTLQGRDGDPPLPIGLVARPGDVVAAMVLRAADRARPDRRMLHVVHHEAPAEAEGWSRALRASAEAGCRIAVVAVADDEGVGEDATASAAARREALASGLRLIAVGDAPQDGQFTHWIGADPDALGRALAAAIQALRPNGARLLELRDGNPRSAASLDGMHRTLRLQSR